MRLSDWVFSTDPESRKRQEKVLRWLSDATGYTGPGSTPTLGGMIRNILFLGPPGTGKDRLCSWLVKVALSDGLSVRRYSGPELFAKARAYMSEPGGEDELIAHLVDCDVLFLSDPVPPGGKLSEYQAQVVYRVLDDRLRLKRPTWATMNVAGDEEAEKRLTPQVWDRFVNGAHMLFCNWKSFRRPESIVNGEGE